MANTPNIIFCTCDQLRAFETGCYGNTTIQTPYIDALAAGGVRFETAVTSYPVCMAARSVMLSGQYNRHCTGGVSNVATSDNEGRLHLPEYPFAGRPHLKDPTLPELLREQGYQTALIGKWHIHSWPNDIGFDHYVMPRVHHAYSGQSFTEDGGPEFVPPGWSVDYESERVEQFLAGQSQADRPFFLFYNISPPHCPMSDAPERYRKMYLPESIPLRPNVDLNRPIKDQDHWFKVYRWDFRYYNFHLPHTEDLPEDFDLRRVIAEYYGMTTWVDDAIGRMLKALDTNGLAGNTIIVFTSDHGDYLGSHGMVQKGNLHDESIRIPLIMRWPDGLRPAVVGQQVAGLVDVAPSLLDLAGIRPPAHMHGQSLAPILRGETSRLERDWSVIETGHGVGIRTLQHLYGLPFEPGTHRLAEAPHLWFDLQADPYELHNLAEADQPPAEAPAAGAAGDLDAALREWDRQTPWMQAP